MIEALLLEKEDRDVATSKARVFLLLSKPQML